MIWGGDEGEQRGNVDVGVHAFDTWAGRWVAPAVLGEARAPKPRSGAASCVVGTRWFISGGGDGTDRERAERRGPGPRAAGERDLCQWPCSLLIALRVRLE